MVTDKYAILVANGEAAYIEALAGIGWFTLPQNPKLEIQERLKTISNADFFQSALAHLYFDAEGFDSGDAYESLLEEILGILDLPGVQFEVADDEEVVDIHLKIGENDYEYQILTAEHAGWLDQNFIQDFMNSVAAAEKMTSRFFCLPPSDQTIEFVFVPEKMYALAVENGIIPEDMEYFMEDAEEE